jgi:hypothetical protein
VALLLDPKLIISCNVRKKPFQKTIVRLLVIQKTIKAEPVAISSGKLPSQKPLI